MKRITAILAVLALAGSIVPAFAETDYVAKKWIQMLKDGSQGSYKGIDGILRSPKTSGRFTTTYGVGSSTADVSVVEYGDGVNHHTVITAEDLAVVMAEGGTGTNGVASLLLYTFPAGRINVEGVIVDNFTVAVDTNALDNADGGDFSFGSAAAGGASGLTSTEVDFCPSTSIDPITNVTDAALDSISSTTLSLTYISTTSVSTTNMVFLNASTNLSTQAVCVAVSPVTSTQSVVTAVSGYQHDGTSTPIGLYLNMEVDDADIAASCTNLVDFVLEMDWKNLGDY